MTWRSTVWSCSTQRWAFTLQTSWFDLWVGIARSPGGVRIGLVPGLTLAVEPNLEAVLSELSQPFADFTDRLPTLDLTNLPPQIYGEGWP